MTLLPDPSPDQLQWVLDHNMQIRGGHRAQIAAAIEAWRAVIRERDALKAEAAPVPPAPHADMIEQFCRDLNAAHDEILRLQGVKREDYARYDWPEWSAPANSIRWAERLLGKTLSKTSLMRTPTALPPAPDPEPPR